MARKQNEIVFQTGVIGSKDLQNYTLQLIN